MTYEAISGLHVIVQQKVPVHYKGKHLGETLRMDVLVEQRVVVEVKAMAALHEAHFAQLLT